MINDLLSSTSILIHPYPDDSSLHLSTSFNSQPFSVARAHSWKAISATINSDLEAISSWGRENLVKFIYAKTHLLPISLSTDPSPFDIIFEKDVINPLSSICILGVEITSNLSWRNHIIQIAKIASQKLGILFRYRKYFTSSQLFKLFVGFLQPFLKYCSHFWCGSTFTLLLDRVDSKAIRLINDSMLTDSLDLFFLLSKLVSPSLLYKYLNGCCSVELAGCVPPFLILVKNTCQATFSPRFCVVNSALSGTVTVSFQLFLVS